MSELQRAIALAQQHATAEGSGRRATLPAPVQGLNTRDPEARMKETFAIQLDNFFPESGVISTRTGSEVYAETGATTPIGTLAAQLAGTAERLFAISADTVYDISDPDEDDPSMDVAAVTIPTAITSSRWRSANLNGQLIMVNGVNAPIRIGTDGTAVAHGFSGATGHSLDPDTLNQIAVHQNRLFFTAKESTKLWYGGLRSVTGELSSIDLGLVNARGGHLAAVGSITLDAGEGVDDILAIITTNGSVFLYQGTDPGTAANWRLAGIFQIGPPIGDKPILQLGSDLVVITVDGFVPLMQFIHQGRSQAQYALSDPIGSLARQLAAQNRDLSGWEAVLHATAGWVVFNVPHRGSNRQLVMNSQSKAWCRFRGMPAECWATWKDRLFFGRSGGEVWEADHGTKDGDKPIRAICRTAYSHLGSPYSKRARRLRAHIESPSTEPVAVGLSADYDRTPNQPVPAQLSAEGARWNIDTWDNARWGAGVARHRQWKKVSAGGVAFSVTISADARSDRATYFGADLLYDQSRGAAT